MTLIVSGVVCEKEEQCSIFLANSLPGRLRHKLEDNITRLESCTVWSILKFQRHSLCHISGMTSAGQLKD